MMSTDASSLNDTLHWTRERLDQLVRAVLGLLTDRVTEGRVRHVRTRMPEALLTLWRA